MAAMELPATRPPPGSPSGLVGFNVGGVPAANSSCCDPPVPPMQPKTLFISMVGTAFAEMCALPFYYPYDLVKVRMQTM